MSKSKYRQLPLFVEVDYQPRTLGKAEDRKMRSQGLLINVLGNPQRPQEPLFQKGGKANGNLES